VNEALANTVRHTPSATSGKAGYLDQVAFLSRNRLRARGWARIPDREMPADSVVLGYADDAGRWNLFAVTETGISRSDVAAAFKSRRLITAGFDRTFAIEDFPEGKATFQAWAVDGERRHAFPISGSFPVTRPQR
jgi:hypothetical protein